MALLTSSTVKILRFFMIQRPSSQIQYSLCACNSQCLQFCTVHEEYQNKILDGSSPNKQRQQKKKKTTYGSIRGTIVHRPGSRITKSACTKHKLTSALQNLLHNRNEKQHSEIKHPALYPEVKVARWKSILCASVQEHTFFPTSRDPISLSQRALLAPLMVAICKMISTGRAVGSVMPFSYACLPLLIKDARYISSTGGSQNMLEVTRGKLQIR
jgi:hypothetical protein